MDRADAQQQRKAARTFSGSNYADT